MNGKIDVPCSGYMLIRFVNPPFKEGYARRCYMCRYGIVRCGLHKYTDVARFPISISWSLYIQEWKNEVDR